MSEILPTSLIILKNSIIEGRVPTSNNLEVGELALGLYKGQENIWAKNSSNEVVNLRAPRHDLFWGDLFLNYNTKEEFDLDLGLGIIKNTAIVFIKDTRQLWADGIFYGTEITWEDIENYILSQVVYTNGNGINVDANVISVKKANDSEAFLVVDENGVAVKGVQDAINAAVKAAKDTINAYTVNSKAISTNPVLGGADINYAEGVTVNAKIDEVAKAVADETERATKAEEDILDLIEDINAEAGKVKVDANDTADYFENKVVSGTADETTNTYAATVTKADNKLNITVKIDTIDGGTY